jgi:hypothetical protein
MGVVRVIRADDAELTSAQMLINIVQALGEMSIMYREQEAPAPPLLYVQQPSAVASTCSYLDSSILRSALLLVLCCTHRCGSSDLFQAGTMSANGQQHYLSSSRRPD